MYSNNTKLHQRNYSSSVFISTGFHYLLSVSQFSVNCVRCSFDVATAKHNFLNTYNMTFSLRCHYSHSCSKYINIISTPFPCDFTGISFSYKLPFPWIYHKAEINQTKFDTKWQTVQTTLKGFAQIHLKIIETSNFK